LDRIYYGVNGECCIPISAFQKNGFGEEKNELDVLAWKVYHIRKHKINTSKVSAYIDILVETSHRNN